MTEIVAVPKLIMSRTSIAIFVFKCFERLKCSYPYGEENAGGKGYACCRQHLVSSYSVCYHSAV